MRQRLSRIVRKVNNNNRQRATAVPLSQVRREAKILRERFPDDHDVIATVNAFEATDKMLADGWTERRGGPAEPKRAELLPEWKKPPPENP